MLEQTVTRRTALKTGGMLVAGAAAGIYLAKGSSLKPLAAGSIPKLAETKRVSNSSRISSSRATNSGGAEPLLLMVKGEEVSVFQGTRETKFVDGQLSKNLLAKFSTNSDSLEL